MRLIKVSETRFHRKWNRKVYIPAHTTLPGYFPGSDKNPKANGNIIGNNGRKPELRTELTLAADHGSFKEFLTFTIFNKAYMKKYGILAYLRVLHGDKIPDNEEFFWANTDNLKEPIPIYKELFGGELLYTSATISSSSTDAFIAGSPDYEYGTIIQKKAA